MISIWTILSTCDTMNIKLRSIQINIYILACLPSTISRKKKYLLRTIVLAKLRYPFSQVGFSVSHQFSEIMLFLEFLKIREIRHKGPYLSPENSEAFKLSVVICFMKIQILLLVKILVEFVDSFRS